MVIFLHLFRQCRSHRNASFPIKSSFFLGAHYPGKSSWRPPGSAPSLGGAGGDRGDHWAMGIGMSDSLSSRANAKGTIDFGAQVAGLNCVSSLALWVYFCRYLTYRTEK